MSKILFILILLLPKTVFATAIHYQFERMLENKDKWTMEGQWKVSKYNDHGILNLMVRSQQNFNFCYTKDVTFTEGSISVKFRANAGQMDQGGGLMWRVQDNDNYYVARFNPLEDNFRFYIVHEGMRSELDSATIKLSAGWHTMKIVQKGSHFEGYLDEQKLLSHEDKELQKSGGVGVWTKADALSSFDDLIIDTIVQKKK